MANFNVTLASTLLELESDEERHRSRFRSGIPSLDAGLLFEMSMSGRLIGIGHVNDSDGTRIGEVSVSTLLL
jgi:hypothetical protein